MQNRILAVVGVILLLVMSAYTASAAAYLHLPGVRGESSDADHPEWTDISSVSVSLEKPGEGLTGQSRRRGDVKLNDITVTKELDSTSAHIMQPLCNGESFPEVMIDLCTSSTNRSQHCYMRYILKNAQVTSYSFSSDADQIPTETISISYVELKVEHTPQDESIPPSEAVCSVSRK